ncbi:hypothetical protein UFOVP118_36 [uncultured Caudovirales phage]|uniref:Uncharacterized protein n=1 Tax=uncultured Caudovirales phage TaxID=2100421 RepID=A0A6J5L833_9CAUD|nr:hypothetical protein UFOVP118_36 [uncultured Caudovirales phage]
MAKPKYFAIDAGFFPAIVYLCFGDDALQQLFDDNKLSTGIHAFDKGEAETITIHTHLGHLIVMVFDLDNYESDENDAVWIGVISHEVSHAVEKLGHFIGEDNLAGETRAYLTQSVVEQVYSASLIERAEIARKRDRKLLNKKGKGKEGFVLEVDLDSNGSSGPDSAPPKLPTVRRTKNAKRRDQSETEDSVQPARTAWVSRRSDSV